MYTEDEAKTKWCPFAQIGAETAMCIGSACMAWRTQTKAFFSVSWPGGTDGAYIGRRATPFGSVKLPSGSTLSVYCPADDVPVGYCGLAGLP